MKQIIHSEDIFFETIDVFGTSVRTTKSYWDKIIKEKHTELAVSHKDVIATLNDPDEVYKSVQDEYIKLFYKKLKDSFLVVVVKYLSDSGFVVTCYQTTKTKRKGIKLWPK